MQHSFLQKFLLIIVAGFAAAGGLWIYRHVVEQARYELNEGWRDPHAAEHSTKR